MPHRDLKSTSASRIKALYLTVRKARGAEVALQFLERSGVGEDLLRDETRPVPSELWARALAELEELLGPDAIEQTAQQHLHPGNLGVWTAVLRGARTPADAYMQLGRLDLDQQESDLDVGDWTTLSVTRSSWSGAAPLPHRSQDIERITRARKAELCAVALVFGARVRSLSAVHQPEQGVTRFEVRWTSPFRWLPLGGATLGTATGFALAAHLGSSPSWSLLGGLLGLAIGAAGWYEAKRRRSSASQAFRIQALERSAALLSRRNVTGTAFETGTVLGGQFRLRKPIGTGAAGSVWEAERLADNQIVALKLLRSAVAHDSQAADRLRREADALGLVRHPNVVEVLDHGHLPSGIAYIVMERLVGESLADYLERQPRLPREEVYDLTLQACDALDALHAAGVVHRDIKPANLFLTTELEGKRCLKLIDFGVAQVAWAETRLTRSGTPLGTPGYMAPEQEAGRVVDGRSDLYALGGVLYEALSGTPPTPPPTSGPDGMVSGARHSFDLGEIDPSWREIIERLLAPWPGQRFADARALRDAVRALQEGASGLGERSA